jgi:uncharacterized membrane-anchored protein YhcB (DUF1043 family)
MINQILAICSAIGTFIGVIAIFLCGKIKAENKRLEENLEDKQSELKTINETQKRIAKYDNISTADKRSWLRTRTKAK